MICDSSNGYAGWTAVDSVTGIAIDYVLWVDPDALEFCTMAFRAWPVTKTIHKAQSISIEPFYKKFVVTKAAVIVQPLSAGRQDMTEPTGKPCAECCQEETCRRLDYCAAHRCGFGERAP